MAAPRRPNVAPALAARRRIGDGHAARRLRAAGWLVLAPDEVPTRTPAALAAEVLTRGDGGAETELLRLVPKLAGVARAIQILEAVDRGQGAPSPQTGALLIEYRNMLRAVAGYGAQPADGDASQHPVPSVERMNQPDHGRNQREETPDA